MSESYSDKLLAVLRENADLKDEVARLSDALEQLEVQSVRDIADGWVSIPEVEWDSIFRRTESVEGREDEARRRIGNSCP